MPDSPERGHSDGRWLGVRSEDDSRAREEALEGEQCFLAHHALAGADADRGLRLTQVGRGLSFKKYIYIHTYIYISFLNPTFANFIKTYRCVNILLRPPERTLKMKGAMKNKIFLASQ